MLLKNNGLTEWLMGSILNLAAVIAACINRPAHSDPPTQNGPPVVSTGGPLSLLAPRVCETRGRVAQTMKEASNAEINLPTWHQIVKPYSPFPTPFPTCNPSFLRNTAKRSTLRGVAFKLRGLPDVRLPR